ncbi:MAG TPA: hypothetical protein VE621_05975 [Bryobacteraceae bacterium]|jgi:hypothetical protein|nr:hypothetical protein [Bryobacteraceae bacterium]
MRLIWLLLLAVPALLAEPKITFIKSFPKSTPAYVRIEVSKSGDAVFRDSNEDDQAISFRVKQDEVQVLFGLAEKVNHFSAPLESNLKVAFMGEKTLRWEDGSVKNEAKFNYTLDENARLLVDWFDRITETQMLLFDLERTARFDRLGVNHTLLQIEAASDRGRLVSRERFLPLLERVAKNDSYLHMARERAASLAEAFRAAKPKAE